MQAVAVAEDLDAGQIGIAPIPERPPGACSHASPAQCLVLLLEPAQRFFEVGRSEVGPVLVDDVEVGVDRLDGEEAAEAPAAAPADDGSSLETSFERIWPRSSPARSHSQ